MVACKLAPVGCGCESVDESGTCSVYSPEGVARRVIEGMCPHRNIRAPQKGIYEPKKGKKANPAKAAKVANAGDKA